MFESEAHWISAAISEIAPRGRPIDCLNLGSSTRAFREVEQPFIHRLIFEKHADLLRVTHCDVKAEDGVDLVGSLDDPSFLTLLAKKRYDLVICTNLLMHLERPELVYEVLGQCVRPGGHLVITNPTIYPYCGDPIDSKYRASVAEIMAHLPGFSPVRWENLAMDEKHIDYLLSNPKPLIAFLANIALPRGGMTRWRRTMSDLKNLFKNYRVACLVMIKSV